MGRTYRVIDSDGHVLEPPDLWQRYIDPAHRDRAPRLVIEEDGRERLLIEDTEKVSQTGFGGLGAFGTPSKGGFPYLSGRKGGFDPHARIEDMDAEGIDAAFLYPSLALFFTGVIKDANLAAATCRAYNRWLADYCAPYPDRLFGVAMLPMQSVELAIQEMQYARNALGMKGGFLRPNPYSGRSLHHPDYDPFWAEAQDLDFCVALHEGMGSGMPTVGIDRFKGRAVQHVVSHTVEMMLACASVIMCGVCDRFPRLRIAFLESGGGWIAPWLDRMDRHFDQQNLYDANDYPLRMRPSEYFRRQCWISFEPVEGCLSYLAEYIGPHKILWATDYPHRDGFPGAPKLIANRPELSHGAKTQILAQGAIDFYKLQS